MAVLTNTGITFSDSTQLNSKYGIFPQTTPVIFYQAAAPTGWSTPATEYNDRALRVVNGTGAIASGTNVFTTAFASKPISATVPVTINGLSAPSTTIDVNTMVQHTHPANSGGNQSNSSPSPAAGTVTKVAPGTLTGPRGGGLGHAHPVSYTSANGPLSTSLDFSVQYINVIYCTFA
jgi:hypothetical protein